MFTNIDAPCCPLPTTRAAPQPASSTVLLDGPAQHKRGVSSTRPRHSKRRRQQHAEGARRTRREDGQAREDRAGRHSDSRARRHAGRSRHVLLQQRAKISKGHLVRGIVESFLFRNSRATKARRKRTRCARTRPRAAPGAPLFGFPPPRGASLCDDDLN